MRAILDRVGKYELKAVLSRTALSTVCDGWDCDIARRVAIKLMPLSSVEDDEAREALARFKRGAQAAGQLNHPNIVSLYDYGETEEYAYLVMEFVDGPTLKALFDSNRRFALAEIGTMFGGILDALQYSHDRRVVHRDMKPANVMFTQNNEVKITDFGIARLEDSEMTQAGMVIGTPAYMSPEQFLGEKIDWRTDLYSAGVLLYHILTGERPYEGTLATIMHKVLYGSPLLPSRLSTVATPALDNVVTRAMAKKPEDRFESATEFNAALQQALAAPISNPGRAFVAPPIGRKPVRKTSDQTASRTVMFAAVVAAVLAAGGIVAWRLNSRPTTQQQAADRAADQPKDVETAPSPVPPPAQVNPANGGDHTGEVTKSSAPPELRGATASESTQGMGSADPRDSTGVRDSIVRDHDYGLMQTAPLPFETKRSDPVPAETLRTTVPQYTPAVPGPVPPSEFINPANKRLEAGSDASTSAGSDRKPVVAGSDRRPPRADPRSGKPQVNLANRANPPADSNAAGDENATAEALRRLRNGVPPVRPGPPVEPNTLLAPIYAATSSSAVGLLCQTVTMEKASSLGLDSARGMVVIGVVTGSAAATAGIRQEDVILKINGAEVRDLSTLAKLALDTPAGHTVPVEIFRHGSQQMVQLRIDQLRP